jgi:hypothetical protein
MRPSVPLPTDWLLASADPWVRYRTRETLLGEPAPSERAELLADTRVRALAKAAHAWPRNTRGDHRSGKDLLNKLAVLADFGLRRSDFRLEQLASHVLARRSPEGLPLAPVVMPMKKEAEWLFDIDGQDPLLALVGLGFAGEPRVAKAIEALVGLARPGGGWTWPDARSPLPCRKFVGGCPYPTLKILRLLAQVPRWKDSPVTRAGTRLLLDLWERREEERRYGFGMGEQFLRLKYPFLWFDVLHVVEALSGFPWVWKDARFRDLLSAVTSQADAEGRFTAGSVWMEWKTLCFGQKRGPSPWLTFVVHRALFRDPARAHRCGA